MTPSPFRAICMASGTVLSVKSLNRLAAFGVASLAWAVAFAGLWALSRVALEWFAPVLTRGDFFGADRVPDRDPTGTEILILIACWVAPFAVAYSILEPLGVFRARAEKFFAASNHTPTATVFAAVGVVAGVAAAVGVILAIVAAAVIWLIFGGLLYTAAIIGGVAAVKTIVD